MKTINKKVYWALATLAILASTACSKVSPLDVDDEAQAALLVRDQKKWAEEAEILKKNKADSALIAEENKRLREIYLEDLRAYKKTKHTVMFGWFAYWNPTSPDPTFSLDHLPDSVDFISNWGQQWNLGPERLAQWDRLREKGTRMTAGWIIENIGDGLKNAPEGGWSNDPHTAIEQYARAIADSVAKYNYDGIDLDYEPQFASPFKAGNHCGDWPKSGEEWSTKRALISCSQGSNKEYENLFFTKLREFLPKEKMMNINGSIGWIDPKVTGLFNYFVYQSYNAVWSTWVSTTSQVMAANPKITLDQFIYTETFQTSPPNANAFGRYVTHAKNVKAGGIGAFHINEDYLYSKYQNVRSAISALNPPMDK